jgi:hypothetical protein
MPTGFEIVRFSTGSDRQSVGMTRMTLPEIFARDQQTLEGAGHPPAGRDQEMVANHQGGRYQSEVTPPQIETSVVT